MFAKKLFVIGAGFYNYNEDGTRTANKRIFGR